MNLKFQLHSLIFILLSTLTQAQPFQHVYQSSFFTFGQMVIPTQDNSYLIGGQNGLFMGYPSFAPFLMKVDGNGNILFQRELQDHWTSELGGINDMAVNQSDASIYVAVETSGCDFIVPGALYKLDSLGNTNWFQEVQQANALAIFSDGSVVVGGNYSGVIKRYQDSGDLIWEQDVEVWISDLTAIEDTLYVLGQLELLRVDQAGMVEEAWEFGEGTGQEVKYWPGQNSLMVRAEDRLYQLDGDMNLIAETGLDLLGQFESMAFDSSHCYLLGRDLEDRRMALVLDQDLNYVKDFPVGNGYQVATNLVVLEDKLIIIGDEVPDPYFGIANTDMWSRPYEHRGSALFLQSYDLDGNASTLKTDVALTQIDLENVTDPVNNGMCYWPEGDVFSFSIESIRVKVVNEGTEVLQDLNLNIRFDPCPFICPTASTFSRSFSNLNLQPGQTTQLGFGNIDVFYVPIDSNANLCIWPSIPNGKMDANPENNEVCNQFLLMTSTAEKQTLNAARVFPNPANDLLIVQWPLDHSTIQSISVMDNLGRILNLGGWTPKPGKIELQVGRLPQGIYYLLITSEQGEQFTLRFVKI